MANIKESVEFKVGALYRGHCRMLIHSEADMNNVNARIYESKKWLSSYFKVVLEGEEIACENVINEIEDFRKSIKEK